MPPIVSAQAPDFVKRVTSVMLAGKGDSLPVSAFPVDGTWPLGTARWEKRDLAVEIPQWDPAVCVQCNKCALVCPHAVIRAKVYAPEHLGGAPTAFRSTPFKAHEAPALRYTIQVALRGLHGLRPLRRGLPGEGSDEPAAQGDRHGRPGADP
jgi:pyruvate-ferredoxin/flavodoxin oxidoreductase